uniref:Calmodulin-lysine N-methyltransferase n=1 Tax=Chlamydomonas leiostraca TaxID=1034604 RepID=A0A7S0WIK6_9CHLO|mmetsp:Transcript_15046/g.37517  ORF Transcript_15046/g.37517 Transcript_15046/m.37517 type:complete len:139 (+) Transcript_15046:3-419(+)
MQERISCEVLSWEDHASLPAHLRPDVVLGSDLLYDPLAIPDLVATLCVLLQPPPAMEDTESAARPVMYMATTRRNESTLDLFLAKAAAAGLDVKEVGQQFESEDEAMDRSRFCHATKLAAARDRILLHAIVVTKSLAA